jgi:hypothetical protein
MAGILFQALCDAFFGGCTPARSRNCSYNAFMNIRRLMLLGLLFSAPAWAVENDAPALSVEDNIRGMDKDHDGMVSMTEIRAHLEAQNGKGYRSELLDEMTARADGRSCSSPFSRSFY